MYRFTTFVLFLDNQILSNQENPLDEDSENGSASTNEGTEKCLTGWLFSLQFQIPPNFSNFVKKASMRT